MTRTAGRQKGPLMLVVMVLLGMIFGSAVGVAIKEVLPDGVVKSFFVEALDWGVEPGTLDLVVLTITLGFSIKVNVMAVLGVVFAVYLFRWY